MISGHPVKYIKHRLLNFINEEVMHRKTKLHKFTKLLSLTADSRSLTDVFSLYLYPFLSPHPSTGSSPTLYINQRILAGTCGYWRRKK